MKKLLYIAILALAVVSCKKEPLPDLPDETPPYYSIDGYIDAEWINLNVGQEGILINQGTTYTNGVETYFGQIVCPSEDLLIKIEVIRPEAPLTPNGLVAMQEGFIPFLVHQQGCKSPSFGSNLLQANYLLIKDELGTFIPTSEIEFDEYGIYDVTMKFTDAGQSSYTIPVQYGYNSSLLNAEYSTFPLGDSVIFAAINQTGSHEWYVDGNYVSNEHEFHHQMDIGIHTVEHKLRDENNNEASYISLVRITDYVLDWQMDMNGCTGPSYESNYGNIMISVLTNGKEYRSDRSSSNSQSSVIVSDVQYVGNASNVPSRVVFDFSFDAMLLDESGTDSLSLTDMSGTFNVGLQ